jgi:hypothetical protein
MSFLTTHRARQRWRESIFAMPLVRVAEIFFCTYFGVITTVLTLFCVFGSAGAGVGNCLAFDCAEAVGSATGAAGLLAGGSAGLHWGLP